MTRVMITGGRDYTNESRLYQVLDAAVERLGLTEVIHGDCPTGADALASRWARDRGIGQRKMPADFDDLSKPDARIRTRPDGSRYDAYAGPRRNQAMIDLKPDHILAFKGDRGTKDAIKRARRAGIEPILIDWEG